jgi:tetraacyldisaccharide 4'-kinase
MPNRFFMVQEILSGRRKGFWASLLRGLLFGFSVPYRMAMGLRNCFYDRKMRAVHSVDCRVISVGNLTTGGAGKTPLVECIARRVLARTDKVAIVSRGYGSGDGEKSDEQMMLCENLPAVPHVTGADRVVCAVVARRKHDARVVILDDAFQHRRLGRDLDIVTIDAINPFGFGHVLPRGLLRESPRSLARADVVVITRSALVSPEELAAVEKDVARLAPDALVVHAVEEVTLLEPLAGPADSFPLDAVAGKRAVAFCGLGNPDAFRRTVSKLGVRLAAFLVFADHHRYRDDHLRAIDSVARSENVDVILTTQKDRVRLPAGFDWQKPVLVVKMEMRLTKNANAFNRRIDELIGTEPLA